MRYRHLLATMLAATLTVGSASAATVLLSNGSSEALDSMPGQDFATELQAADATTMWRGPLSLTLTDNARLTFTLVAANSSWDNSFNFQGATVLTETFHTVAADSLLTGSLGGQAYTTGTIAGGTVISDFLSFTSPMRTSGAGDIGFGVRSNASIIESGASVFFLAFDDGGGNDDSDFDDIILRVDVSPSAEVSPVPLPAGIWLMAAGMGGLLGLGRMSRRPASSRSKA